MREIAGRVFEPFRVDYVENGALRRCEVEAENEGAAQRAIREAAKRAGVAVEVLRAQPRAEFGFR